MSPATTKKCTRCGEGFRGTMAPEEVHCAKCFVKTCEVPEDTDEQFLKLVSEAHGPELAMTNPKNTAALLPMMKDILNHKARLKMLEKDVEENRYKSTKEKNRTKREIFRLREEKKEMDVMVDTIKAKMMHLVFIHPSQSKLSKSSNTPGKTMPSPVSSQETSVFGTPLQSPTSPRSPNIPRSPSTHAASKTPNKVEKENTPKLPIDNNTETAPRPSLENIEQQNDDEPPPNSPKRSPVKLAAAKFEEAAKKVNTMVTFAKLPTIKKSAAPHTPKKEVNNNDTPVTASSSSEDDECELKPSMLVRSNSVRDRIKAFEEIQRSASTGSYDRRKAHAAKGIGRRSLTSMKSINV